MKQLVWFLQTAGVLLATLPIALLPHRIALWIGGWLGILVSVIWGKRRRIALDNLRDAVARGALEISATPETVIRDHFRNLGKSFVEIVKIYYGLGGKVFRSVEIRGDEHFRKALDRGKGILVITGHCGNWELNALACSVKVTAINVVARPINNPLFDWLVARTRKKYGNRLIYKKGALKEILAALKRNEAVGILMDQSVMVSEGIRADFLGKTDYIMKTPALIAAKTGCAVMPAFIRRSGNGHIIEGGEVIELVESTGDSEADLYRNSVNFSRPIEEFIRKYPSEWLWIHRRWKRLAEQEQHSPIGAAEVNR